MVARKFIYLSLSSFFFIFIAIIINLLPLSKEAKIFLGYSKNAINNFTEATAQNQYISEEHTIVTEDQYVLTLFRITKGKKCNDKKKQHPVLLMHGLFENSDIFLDAGPSAGLAYLLSDSCFDVWVGNQRGNNYGRRHLRLNPDKDSEFWQFSIDEIGLYDVPASIDYILKYTGPDKLNYVGFSQGATIFFVMCSERPEYCKKIGIMIALAPGAFIKNSESLFLRIILKSVTVLQRPLNLLGIQEVFSKGSLFQELIEYVCHFSDAPFVENFCASGAFMDSYNSGSIAPDTRRLIFSHFLVGTSVNVLVRYHQGMISGKFQKLDYGEKVNLERYNSTSAPEYNLTAVTTPVLLIQGRNDKLVNIHDVKTLSTKLPNVLEMHVVSDPNWKHMDMIYSQNIKTMIYPKIYENLQKEL